MPTRRICESANSSFFLIDKNYKVTFFKMEPQQDLGSFLAKSPSIGDSAVEMIAQKYRKNFQNLLDRCFGGLSFSIEQRFAIEKSNDLFLQIIFTPLSKDGEEDQVICTLINNTHVLGPMKMLTEYSHLTSHELRAPITNILSLSTITNYQPLESYDILKINQLLSDINLQALKLDEIIKMLNSILHQQEHTDFFDTLNDKGEHKHIVLVDDDVITNRLHQMLIKKHHSDKKIALFDDPQIALGYIKTHHPDLILLDLHMPEIDGWKFLHMMEEHNVFIDVVIVSSSIDPRERLRAKSFMCVKDFYVKPLTSEKVKQLLED
ncbi:response regulator [Pedobacter caeni]|uniref:Response regulator receiver domain-containing protein n=1 Tax=Pedobacter caeni TaxID=288992 RepID=A0A1M5G437_9SPHI|nr:response regulator [Pedobacter caeni]SHF98486.1 Response regulator receiver domain-containing protein [Pedobacter caeni]